MCLSVKIQIGECVAHLRWPASVVIIADEDISIAPRPQGMGNTIVCRNCKREGRREEGWNRRLIWDGEILLISNFFFWKCLLHSRVCPSGHAHADLPELRHVSGKRNGPCIAKPQACHNRVPNPRSIVFIVLRGHSGVPH